MAEDLPGIHKALSSNLKQIKSSKTKDAEEYTRELFNLHVWWGGEVDFFID